MERKKILILYTSVGLGHKSIAENIGFALSRDGYEVKLEDILQVENGPLVNAAKKIHGFINTHVPFIWSSLYKSKWFTSTTLPWRVKIAGRNYLNTKIVVESFQPDAIITTQTAASAVVAYLVKQKIFTGKFGIAFSDFHLHRYWLYPEADFYLANILEQKEEMARLGIPEGNIYVCGMTLKPKPEVDSTAAKNKFGVRDGQRVVLVSSGSQGTGLQADLVAALAQKENNKVIVICGKNQKAFRDLTEFFSSSSQTARQNVSVLGYYSEMDELYAIADIFVTKPGGLSVAEAVRWNVPVLVSHVLPGQEELNFEYLEDKGLVMSEPLGLAGEVKEEIEAHGFRGQLVQNTAKKTLFPDGEPLLKALHSVLQDR